MVPLFKRFATGPSCFATSATIFEALSICGLTLTAPAFENRIAGVSLPMKKRPAFHRIKTRQLMSDSEPEKRELDPATKLEVQNYLVKFITPPAVIVAILSFVVGLAINQGALTEAMKQITPEMIKSIHNADVASASAQSASQEVNKSLDRILESERKLNTNADFLKALTNNN
jgi:hypothetical protein